jgi:hypothetical protein
MANANPSEMRISPSISLEQAMALRDEAGLFPVQQITKRGNYTRPVPCGISNRRILL